MFVRLLIAGALALGLFATNAGAVTPTAEAQMFQGKTGQGHQIKIVVRKNAFRIHTFNVDLRCRDGSKLLIEEGGFLWTKPKRNGSFKDAQFGKTDSVYFRGRVTKKRIRGKLRVTDKEKNGPKCNSKWVRFNVTPR